MAEITDVPYLVPSNITTAGSIGVPEILIERGCLGLWTHEEVDADKKDVKNILRFLGVLHDEMETVIHHPIEVEKVIYDGSCFTECWYPRKKTGQKIRNGEILGEIRDYFGKTLHICKAKMDGVLLYQTKSLNIIKNDIMVAYGPIHGYQKNREFVNHVQ